MIMWNITVHIQYALESPKFSVHLHLCLPHLPFSRDFLYVVSKHRVISRSVCTTYVPLGAADEVMEIFHS